MSPFYRASRLLPVLLAAAALPACSSDDEDGASASVAMAPTSAPSAAARGTLTLTEQDGGLRVTGTLTGVPAGEHGFHFHLNASCGDADLPDDADTNLDPAGAAGPHWDPLSTSNHDSPSTPFPQRHGGDLGNVTASSSGTLNVDAFASSLRLDGTYSVRGHALILHANRDDLSSEPAGNSGTRIACGIVPNS